MYFSVEYIRFHFSLAVVLFSLVNSKRRKTEKVGKGLRHFSMKVCEKVRKKGTTSYNEVADELVAEFTNPSLMTSPTDQVNVCWQLSTLSPM
jgi:hypothetical protein